MASNADNAKVAEQVESEDQLHSEPRGDQSSETSSDYALPKKIEVRGDVRLPGQFSYQEEADIFHYLNLAGGAKTDPKLCNLIVVRQYGTQRRSLLFRLDQREYLPRVRQGDLIIISELGEAKRSSRQFHKPAITNPKQKIIRPDALEFESSLPPSAQALKRAIGQYIRNPQFKRLLNQIASHQAATGAKSIAIMSCESSEGKSFFCSALALGYANFLDSQVLMVDSNRNPRHRSAHLTVVKGDYSQQVPNQDLHEESAYIDLTSVSEIERDFHENSDFYFAPYIRSIHSNYDIILVDTSAAAHVPDNSVDPMIIASQVDAVLVITSPASLDKKGIEKFTKDLKCSGATVLGTVYNSFIEK